jgi:exosome complex RNA-binding protein Rrp4
MKYTLTILLLILFGTADAQWSWVSNGDQLYLKNGNDSTAITTNSVYTTAKWGSIFGTLSQQTDLVNALALKQTIPAASQGLGGTVTQNANKGTAVTINKQYGQITMNNAALAAAAEVSFTVNNSTVVSTDVVIVNVQSVGTAGAYLVSVGSVSNGAFTVTVSNASAGSLSQAIVINFCVIKSFNN